MKRIKEWFAPSYLTKEENYVRTVGRDLIVGIILGILLCISPHFNIPEWRNWRNATDLKFVTLEANIAGSSPASGTKLNESKNEILQMEAETRLCGMGSTP
tara:strand:- start:5281 stop:5583 length:303 start_codon:yes stop_codon:yes gene_type:complete